MTDCEILTQMLRAKACEVSPGISALMRNAADMIQSQSESLTRYEASLHNNASAV